MMFLERKVIAKALREQIDSLRDMNARQTTTLAQRTANYERIAELERALREWEAQQ